MSTTALFVATIRFTVQGNDPHLSIQVLLDGIQVNRRGRPKMDRSSPNKSSKDAQKTTNCCGMRDNRCGVRFGPAFYGIDGKAIIESYCLRK